MPNPNTIRYSTATQSGALRKGNFYLGVTDRDYGPTNITGYYNGVTFSSGYLSYFWDGSEIRYNLASNDSQLTTFLSTQAGIQFSGLTSALLWSVTQSGIMVNNRTYENVVTDSLFLNYDASLIASYPFSGNTWYNLNGTPNGLLTNGPTFSSANFGMIGFDGVDDHINLGTVSSVDFSSGMTIEVVVRFTTLGAGGWERFLELNSIGSGTSITFSRNSTFNTIAFQCRNITGGDAQRRFISTSNQIVTGQIAVFSVTMPVGTPGNPTSGCQLYKNGAAIAGAAHVSGEEPRLPSAGNRTICYIGRSPFVGNAFLNGAVYSLRMYNRTLTAAQILQNYQSTLPRMIDENIVTNGLIFFVDAGYSTSFTTASNTWFDISGLTNNGTLTNGPTFSTANGGSISFDGVDDFVVSSTNTGISGAVPRTIQAWINMSGATYSSFQYYSVAKIGPRDGFGSGNGNIFEILMRYESDLNRFSSWGHFYGIPDPIYDFNTLIPLNTWAMITLVYTGTIASVHVNNVTPTADANNVVARTINTTNTPVDVGRRAFTSGHSNMRGRIAQVRVYNRALTQSEINQNFNAQRSVYGI